MGKSEKRVDCIQSPVREEYEKTASLQEGVSLPPTPPLSRFQVFLVTLYLRYPWGPISQMPLREPYPKGPEKHLQIRETDKKRISRMTLRQLTATYRKQLRLPGVTLSGGSHSL